MRPPRAGFAVVLVASAWIATACDVVDLKRMDRQPSFHPFEAEAQGPGGMAMRSPPPGTIPRSRILGPTELVDGREGDAYVTTIPVALDRNVLERGHDRFRIFCAACHGHAGDGRSKLAASMALRRPPSLVEGAVAEYPAGRLFEVMSKGYGLMPAYAQRLEVSDRWAVVAYVQALQLRRAVALDTLPSPYREEAETWLR